MASEPYYFVARVECALCTHQWVGVFPYSADEGELECPNCHDQDSNVEEYLGPELKGRIAYGALGEIVEYRANDA